MRGRRGFLASLAALIAVGLLLLVSANRWASSLPTTAVPESITLLRAAGWICLAGVAGVVATSGPLRRFVGGLVALTGSLTAVAVSTSMQQSPSGLGWPIAALCFALAGVAVGVVVAVWSGDWPGFSARFQQGPSGIPGSDDGRSDTPLDLWRALDRGDDPTR